MYLLYNICKLALRAQGRRLYSIFPTFFQGYEEQNSKHD